MSTNYKDVGIPFLRDVGVFESQDSGGASSYTLTADAGSYTLTGIAAITSKALILTAVAGSYALSGQAAAMTKGPRLLADTGTYTVSGQAAILRISRTMAANTGTYIVAGQAANLTTADVSVLQADTGAYNLSGQAATFHTGLTLVANTGSYVLSGRSANLNFTSGALVVVGGRQNTSWFKGIEELKKAKPDFPYDHKFPPSREKKIHHAATVLARAGGHARAESLTQKQRTDIARMAAKARWK